MGKGVGAVYSSAQHTPASLAACSRPHSGLSPFAAGREAVGSGQSRTGARNTSHVSCRLDGTAVDLGCGSPSAWQVQPPIVLAASPG